MAPQFYQASSPAHIFLHHVASVEYIFHQEMRKVQNRNQFQPKYHGLPQKFFRLCQIQQLQVYRHVSQDILFHMFHFVSLDAIAHEFHGLRNIAKRDGQNVKKGCIVRIIEAKRIQFNLPDDVKLDKEAIRSWHYRENLTKSSSK